MCSAASPGRSTLKTESVLLFDLDETILSVNSFRHWVLYMLCGRFIGLTLLQRLKLSVNVVEILIERKIKKPEHILTKRRLQKLWHEALSKDQSQFALASFLKYLNRFIRPNMKSILACVARDEVHAVMVTAAAGDYADIYARHLGFRHVISTPPITQGELPENRGAQKRDTALAFLAAHGWAEKKRIFFTDHKEDLPLIKECQLAIWMGAESGVEELRALAPGVEIVPCLNKDVQGLLELVTT